MKRIRIIIMLLVILLLNGCGNEANVPFSESKAPPDIVAMAQEKDPGSVTDVSSQQVSDQSEEDVSESYVPEEDPPESHPSEEKSETEQVIESEPEPESEPMSEPETEDESEQTSDPSTEEAEEETDSEPENETEAESEQEPITNPAFDIEYWISYARDTAAGLGLEFDSTAVDCWDNPITANPDCIYLERDITARLSRYADDEDITAVWIWYENIGTNKYLIYIGYA